MMKIMKYVFVALLCVSAALFAAAPRDRAAIEADISRVQALVQAGDFDLFSQLEDLRHELAVLEQRQVADGRLYLTQQEDNDKLRSLNYLSYYNDLNQARIADNLAHLMSQGSRAQFMQLRSFRQAKELCGFAALANLYAINQLVVAGLPVTYENVRDRAQNILDTSISTQPRFQELAARNEYAEAESSDLMNVARAIGFNEPLFFLSIFGRGAATTQGFFRGVPTALFEEGARSQDGMPYLVAYSYKGPHRENLRDVFVLTENRNADKEPEEIVFQNVITSLRTQPTTNFIVNSDRGHYCAICVVRGADESHTMYYLDSVNSPMKENDFNLLDTVLWVDHLIQRAQQGASGSAGSATSRASAAAREQEITDVRNLIEQFNQIIERAEKNTYDAEVLEQALYERDLQIDILNRLLQRDIADDFSSAGVVLVEAEIDSFAAMNEYAELNRVALEQHANPKAQQWLAKVKEYNRLTAAQKREPVNQEKARRALREMQRIIDKK